MKNKTFLAAFALALLLPLVPSLRAQVPQLINYQGRVAVGTVNFDGAGSFKFALVDAAGTTTYWSNDGTSTAGAQPTAGVALTVTKGLYSVLLGDTALANMTAIPVSVFSNSDVRLRVWFDDGANGFQLLTPDQRLAPNGYLPTGTVTAEKIAPGAVQDSHIATGTITNGRLANPSLTVTAGNGLSGGGVVSLGGSVSLANAGVLSLTGGGGITVDASTGGITLGSTATPLNLGSSIVQRDATGGFTAGTITATLNGNATSATTAATAGSATFATTAASAGSAVTFTGALDGDVTGPQGATTVSKLSAFTGNGFVKTNGGTGALSIDTSTYLTGNQPITLSGDLSGSGATAISVTIPAATVTGKALTGFSSTTGTITATDSILSALNKLNGNVALKAPLASPSFTGTVLMPAGTAAIAPLRLQTGTLLNTPVFGAVEFDGTAAYLTTNSASPTRKTLAFTDSTISAAQIGNGTITSAMLANGAVGSTQLAAGAVAAPLSVAGASQAALANTNYVATSSSPTTITVPATANVGDTVQITGQGAGGWTLTYPWLPHETNRSWLPVASSADGAKLVAGVLYGQLYTSADSGVTWTARGSSRGWQGLASSADGTKLVAAAYYDRIYTSTDSGVTWTARENVRPWTSVASSADGSVLVAGHEFPGGVYVSTNSGATWTMTTAPLLQWNSVAASANGSKLVAGSNLYGFYTSADGGANWVQRSAVVGDIRGVATSADGASLVAVVDGGFIYTSTDSGVTWTQRESSRAWRSVASSSDGTQLVATVLGGQIYVSTNSGVTWAARDSARAWQGVACSADGAKFVAVADGGQIYTSRAQAPLVSGAQGTHAAVQYLGNGLWAPVAQTQIAAGAVGSSQLTSNLTLGGTTSGAFSGNLSGNAATATNFTGSLAGEITGPQGATAISAGTVTGKALTGFASTTGTITASDTLLSAINKLDGNLALKAPLASPTFTGTVSGTFSGNGAALTSLNASSIGAGTLNSARLPSNVALLDAATSGFTGRMSVGSSAPGAVTLLQINAATTGRDALRLTGTDYDATNADPNNGVSFRLADNSFENRALGLASSTAAIDNTVAQLQFGVTSTYGYATIASRSTDGTAATTLLLNPFGGNVGIGTVPSSRLHVNGTVTAESFSGSGAALTNLNGANISVGTVTEANLGAGTVTAAKLGSDVGLWSVNGGNVYRGSGAVGIGTASPISNTPLHVALSLTKTATSETRTVLVTTSETSAPFGVDIRLKGSATAAARAAIMQTGEINQNDTGILAFQPIGGVVNIGSSTPVSTSPTGGGKLNVIGGPTLSGISGAYLNGAGSAGTTTHGPHTISIYATDGIWTGDFFVASSDARIKTIAGRSDGANDLATLLGLEITDYRYKDVIGKGATPQKKVIAQQVEKVFPQAVSQRREVVPDIYQKATCTDGWIALATDLKTGDRVKLIGKKSEGIYEVLEVAPDRFRTAGETEDGEVFVYGREMSDFRTVDYDALAMLNVSATQELARKLKAKEEELVTMKQRLAELEAKDQEREARLARLEQLISSAPKSGPTTAVFKGGK